MTNLRALVRACHPEPTLLVTGIATALALTAGRGWASALVTLAFLSGQLSVGWSNDWIDAARDRAVGRTDKPVVTGLPVAVVRRAALLALVACVPLSLLLGRYAGPTHLLAVASAWTYNSWLKRTWASWLPFALSFGLVPSIVVLGRPGHPFPPAGVTAAGALLGVGAHLANVLPDLEDDAATGVRGIGHRLGRRRAGVLAGALLLVATALLARGRAGAVALVVATVSYGVGLLRSRRPGSRSAFLAVLVVAAVDVALLVAGGAGLR